MTVDTGLSPATRLMECPKCGNLLQVMHHEGVEVDLCPGCDGCWLDADELEALTQAIGGHGLAVHLLDPAPAKLQCPRCQGELYQGEQRGIPGLVLDQCQTCRGVWLDRGESEIWIEGAAAEAQLATAATIGEEEAGDLLAGWGGEAAAPEVIEAAAEAAPAPEHPHQYVPTLGSGGFTRAVLQRRWEVKGTMLRGRFSTLLRAMDRDSGSPAVLRRLNVSLPKGATEEAWVEKARVQMFREGQLLRGLAHPNLPQVREIFQEDEHIYLVLEDFSGRTLQLTAAEKKRGVNEALLLRFFRQLVSVVDYLHSQEPPIVHRDLRPETILMTPDGVLKLAEFGLVEVIREHQEHGGTTQFRYEGSPRFAPPEQLLGEPSDPANDRYALGAIMYYLSTGMRPPTSMDLKAGTRELDRVNAVRPDISSELAGWVHALLCPDRERRLGALGELKAWLEGASAGTPAPEPLPVVAEEEVEASPEAEATVEAPAAEAGAEPPPAADEAAAYFQNLEIVEPKSGPKVSLWKMIFGKKEEEQEVAIDSRGQLDLDLEQFPFVELREVELERRVMRLLPENVAKSIEGIALEARGSTLIVAVKNPGHIYIYDNIAYATQGAYRPELVRADPALIDLAIQFGYQSMEGDATPWLLWLERKKLHEEHLTVTSSTTDMTFGAEDITGPVVEAADKLIKEAISAGASDIHMETFEQFLVIRYRIDGILHEVDKFDPRMASALVKRMKILANMDIAQDRVTQGGRISVKVGPHEFDMRVSIVPVPEGESMVMRLLKKGNFDLSLSDLGFLQEDLARYGNLLEQPYGMILVSGPTGSGKSTTLYASLVQIMRPDRKLLTIEDPIEYRLPGITQVQVNTTPQEPDKKVTFSRALREFLRQDPDIILVGEIRDAETAGIAIEAALTGHMLLSTIHTNDSIGIIARLRDMGVEPFLISASMLGGVAQRLARRICPSCKDEIDVPSNCVEQFAKAGIDSPHLFRGKGCPDCHGTGYRGRVGLYEILEVSSEVRELISAAARENEIREAAIRTGFKELLHDGLHKANAGRVTLEEVHRVCKTIG